MRMMRAALLSLLCLLPAVDAWAAIAYGTTRAGATSAGTSHTASITTDVASPKLIVFASLEGSASITAMAIDGNSMTQIDSQVLGTSIRLTSWRYDSALAAGTYNLTWTSSSSFVCQYALVQITGAATGAVEANAYDTQDNTAAVVGDAVNVTSTNGASLIAYAYNTSTSPTVTVSGDVSSTPDYNNNAGAGTVTIAKATLGSSGTKTGVFTYSSNSTNKSMMLVSVAAAPSGTLTDVNTTETFTSSATALPYTGTGLTDADGLLVKTGTKSAAATSFSATNSTSGTFTAPTFSSIRTGGVKFGGSVTFDIQDGGISLATLGSGTLNIESGWQIHNVTGIGEAGNAWNLYYGHSGAIAIGDQFACDDDTDGNSWAVTIDSDGYPTAAAGGSKLTDDIDCYIWDATDETWGTIFSYQFTTTPALTNLAASSIATTTATLSVDTDIAEGTVYACVQAVAVATPSHAQIAAGNNGAGAACVYAGSDASVTVPQTFAATGLTADTDYEHCHGQANAATTPLTATVVCNPFSTLPVGDTTPSAFTFTDLTNVALATEYASNAIQVLAVGAGLDVPISVTGGAYAVSDDGVTYGSYTTSSGVVQLSDWVRVRHTSSADYATATGTVLTIGGVSDTWTTTTRTLSISLVRQTVRRTVKPTKATTVH